ncbi:MAG: fibrobacter succinogenes major paralogous domain-containing protein [Fibromonadaceae bacterium]|jgi:uncharacterized protein (TIGR02145 family)|nr:fibrobacter succinogenes major paralogous domain-containing protein [Fibromonadaceae bacterium]
MNRVKLLSKNIILKILFIGAIGVQTISCSLLDDGNDGESSSSSAEPSSSSTEPSSSSVEPSSSSGNGGLCAGFVDETPRMHFEAEKTQFCDERDGQKYVYVTIGEQIWMAENLNYNAAGSMCYDNLESNCDIYGRLYDWDTAMNGAASSNANPSGVQGVCPDGWHLPGDAEWTVLTSYAEDTWGRDSGDRLKTSSGWNPDYGADAFGFSALPGGRGRDGSFDYVGSNGSWWSTTESNASVAWYRSMGSSSDVSWFSGDKASQFSVRCVKD